MVENNTIEFITPAEQAAVVAVIMRVLGKDGLMQKDPEVDTLEIDITVTDTVE